MTNPPSQTGPEVKDRRLVAVGVGTAVALVMLALALVFTSSFGAKQVATNAQDLHWTNAVLGAAAIEMAKTMKKGSRIVTVIVDRRDRYFAEYPNEHYVV